MGANDYAPGYVVGTHRVGPNYSSTILSRFTLNTKNQEHNGFLEKSCNFVL